MRTFKYENKNFEGMGTLNPGILTPPPTVETPSPMPASPKRKRQRIRFVNYLDDDESTKKRRSLRLRSKSHPYK